VAGKNHSDPSYSANSDDESYDEVDRDEVKEVCKLSSKDTTRIRFGRFVVTVVLLLTVFAVTLATYTFLEQQEYENFVTAVNIEFVQQKDMREAFKAFCNFFSQSAIDANVTWPFYSLTNFEVLASTLMKQSGVEVMGKIQ
jgi:hypothetical protein